MKWHSAAFVQRVQGYGVPGKIKEGQKQRKKIKS
jgi:hypothetical protein